MRWSLLCTDDGLWGVVEVWSMVRVREARAALVAVSCSVAAGAGTHAGGARAASGGGWRPCSLMLARGGCPAPGSWEGIAPGSSDARFSLVCGSGRQHSVGKFGSTERGAARASAGAVGRSLI